MNLVFEQNQIYLLNQEVMINVFATMFVFGVSISNMKVISYFARVCLAGTFICMLYLNAEVWTGYIFMKKHNDEA